MKALKSTQETFTYADAQELADKLLTEYIYYLYTIVQEATEDNEERSNIIVNMSGKLSKLLSSYIGVGVLKDEEEWFEEIKASFPKETRDAIKLEIVEVSSDDA